MDMIFFVAYEVISEPRVGPQLGGFRWCAELRTIEVVGAWIILNVKGSGAPFLYSENPFYVNKIKCYIGNFPHFFHAFNRPVEKKFLA
jgi:hypothetical protein